MVLLGFIFPLAVGKRIELDNEPIYWERNTATNIDGVDHTDVELVAVVWLDFEVVTLLFEAIADTRVEDSNVLLGCVVVPERILGADSFATNSQPWAALKDDYISAAKAKDFLDAWSELEARQVPLFVGVDASVAEVEVVDSLDAANQLGCEFIGDEDGWVDVSVSVAQVVESFRNQAASVGCNCATIFPEMGWVLSSDFSINSRCWSRNQTIDYLVPQIYLAAELVSTLRKSILASEESRIPEILVLVAHADAVSVFAVEAEAKLFKRRKRVDARNFAVENEVIMTFIFAVCGVFESFALEEAEWVLIFDNVDDKLLTILEVGKEGTSINHALAGEEGTSRAELLVHLRLFDEVALDDFTI